MGQPPEPAAPSLGGRFSYYYGWNIVALSLIASLFSVGITFYTHDLFRQYLIDDFGFTRGETYDVYSLYIAAVAFYSFFITPRLIERFGAKRVILLGCGILALGLFGLGMAPSKAFYFADFALVLSLGTNCMGMIASRTVLAYWFEVKRAQALSISAVGITAGGVLHVPLAQYLLSTFGWRGAYEIFGIIILVLATPLIALFWKDEPQDVGLAGEPASWGKPPVAAVPDDAPPMNHKELLTNSVFLRMALSLGMASACWGIILQSLISDFVERGYERAQAAHIFSALVWIILVGKPLLGPIGDKIDRKWAIFITVAIQVAGLWLFLLSRFYAPLSFTLWNTPLDAALLVAMVLYGTGVGGCQPLFSAYTADMLGKQTFVRAAGITVPLVIGCQLVGYRLNSMLIDATGSLLDMWYLMAGFYTVSVLLALTLPRADRLGQRSAALGEADIAPSAMDSELIVGRLSARKRAGSSKAER